MAAGDVSIRFAAEGDASLKSAVQAIDAQMRALNEQLKASTEGMKNLSTQEDASAKRTEALTGIIAGNQEKLKILGEQYDQAKTKLDQLAEAMRKAQESGDPAAIDKATTAYNKQSAEVSKLEGAMAKAEGEIAKAGNAMADTGSDSDDAKGKIEQLANTMSIQLATDAVGKVVSAMERVGQAVMDAGKALWDMASDASTFADDLITQATKTGISTQALQEYAYAARFVDTEVSTVTSSMVKLTKNMSSSSKDTQAAFSRLGVAVKDSGGNMRDTQSVFWDAIDALGKVENATERDQLAMQIFGKSAQDLNPLIKAGSETWNSYAQEARDAGLILEDDAVGALGTFNDGLQRIDATMEAAQRQIMGALAPAFSEIADAVADAAQEFTRWIQTDEAKQLLGELTELAKNLASSFLQNLQPAISKAIDIFKSISGAVQFLSDNFETIAGVITGLIGVWLGLKTAMAGLQIAALVTNPMGGVVAAIAAVVAAIGLLVANWDKVKQAGAKAWEMIKSAWNAAGSWFSGIVSSIANAFTSIPSKISGFFSQAWSAIQSAWGSVVSWFSGIVSNVSNAFTSIPSKISGFFSQAWSAIQSAWSSVVSWFSGIVSNVSNAFTSIPSKISGFFSQAWSSVQSAWNSAKSWFSGIASSVTSAFNSIPSKIGSFFSSAWSGVQSAWSNAGSRFSQIGSTIVQAISSTISQLPSKALGWARDMMEGFGRGISNFMSKVTQPVKDLASKIAGFLHFSRPDEGPLRDYETWMPDFVGGLARTLQASQPVLDRAVASLASGIEGQAKGITLSASQTAASQQPIVLQVDGKTFARLVTPYVDSQQGQTWGTSMRLGVSMA